MRRFYSSTKHLFSAACSLLSFTTALIAAPEEWMPRQEDFTQLSWTDGPPQIMSVQEKPKAEVLRIVYGKNTLLFDTKRVRPVTGEWECTLIDGDRRFDCKGHVQASDEFLQAVRFVESGRFFQRVVIEGLKFSDDKGQEWPGTCHLEITTWPNRLAFRLETEADVMLRLRYGQERSEGKKSCVLPIENLTDRAVVESELPVTSDESLGCHRLALPEKPWSNAQGTYYPEEHLDRIDRWRVTLRNDSDSPTVARLMFTQHGHMPITGFTPMLCDADGTPTGLPVQLSKNWHSRPEKGRLQHDGQWFHGFSMVHLPAKSKREFIFQIVYARYGGICAASHAQLCLIGWGHNQFWDQAAVGSFGESICFEPGRVQRRSFITDVRPLMTLSRRANSKRLGWADNCGGGDFLMWKDSKGNYQTMMGTRTDYRSHGPCLTDVSYSEESRGGEISARMEVSVPAANDHLRTFVKLRYDVKKPMRWQRLAFMQLGADYYNCVPARSIAVGDLNALREEWKPSRAADVYDRQAVPLTGEAPWISVHGVEETAVTDGHANATRGIIVHSWRAVLGGKPAAPHLATFCNEWGKGNHRTAVELSPPPDVKELLPGDFVEAEIEIVVFPADPSSYYGPDALLRQAVEQSPNSWQVVHREAKGNQLQPTASVGNILHKYPLVVAVDKKQQATIQINGGLGHCPVTFTGLNAPKGHRITVDEKPITQWQTDWNPATKQWQITCNVPVGENQAKHISLQPAR